MAAPSVSASVFGGATGNSYSSTTTQPSDSQIRYVDNKLEYLDFDDVPLQQLIGYGKPISVRKVEWADRKLRPFADTVNETFTDSDLTLTVSNGVRFQQYQVIKIEDEVLLVTARSGNDLTVTRGWGATSAAAHASGTAIRIVGVAMPENTDTPPAPMTLGGFYFNYFQLFDSGIQISNRANDNGEENYLIRRKEWNQRVEEKFTEAALQLEYTLYHGVKVDATGALPSTMGGFPEFITEHVTDLTGAPLRKTDIKELLQEMFADVGKANMAKTVSVGAFAKEVFNSFYDPARRLTGDAKSITDHLDAIETDYGRITFLMHYHNPDDEAYFINTANLSIHPFGSYGRWHEKRLPESGPYMKGRFTGDYTLQAKGDRAHGKIVNLSSTRAAYPSLAE